MGTYRDVCYLSGAKQTSPTIALYKDTPSLVQGRIGIALRGTQAVQLRTEAALVAAATARLYLHRAAQPRPQSMFVGLADSNFAGMAPVSSSVFLNCIGGHTPQHPRWSPIGRHVSLFRAFAEVELLYSRRLTAVVIDRTCQQARSNP